MAGATGRIEDAQVARVFPGASSRPPLFAPHEVTAPHGEATALTVHFEPRPPERVVDEKLDDVARREELVANGQLATVARCLALLAHPLALVARVEELVHPPDGLVFTPHAEQVRCVQHFQQRLERHALRPEHRRRIPSVEEDLHLRRQLVEQALDEEAVAGAVGEQSHAGRQAAELAVARRLLALGNALLHKLARLEHLERDEAVERRERGVADVVGDSFRCRHPGRSLVLDRGDDLVALEDLLRRRGAPPALRRQPCHPAACRTCPRAARRSRPRAACGLAGSRVRWRCVCPCPSATLL